MTPIISVQLDEVSALAAELAALAAELDDDARLCRSAIEPMREALGGDEGARASSVALAWSTVVAAVADRADVAARDLVSAVAAYRAVDEALAGQLCPFDPAYVP